MNSNTKQARIIADLESGRITLKQAAKLAKRAAIRKAKNVRRTWK